MIPKISSNELNNILIEAQDKLNLLSDSFNEAKGGLEDRLKVILCESAYVQESLMKIRNNNYRKIDGMVAVANSNPSGIYDIYGSSAHARAISLSNVFNLEVSALGEHYFREDVEVLIDNKQSNKFLNILKHDSLTKDIAFDFFKEDTLTLTIMIPSSNKRSMLAPTRFNIIEIDPFLHGSFNIEETRIYEFTETGIIDEDLPPIRLPAIPNVGIERIVMPQKNNFYKMEMDIKINFNYNGVYPFGLKHLYLYNANFRNDNYMILEINADNNISLVKNEITIRTPFGTSDSTIEYEDIELYLDRDGTSDTLYSPVAVSHSDNINEMPRNTKKIYVKVPIKNNESITGIKFNILERNN